MKRMFLISVMLIMVFTCLSGEIVQYKGKDVIAYWSFNEDTTSDPTEKPEVLYPDIGDGKIELPSKDKNKFYGTVLNQLEGFEIDDQANYAIGYEIKSAATSKELFISCSTNYYKDIVLSYVARRAIGGYTKHTIYYLDANNEYQDKCFYNLTDTEYNLRNIDFSNISEINNISDFMVKITLSEGHNVQISNQNRFDNILITGTPIHDFIPTRPDKIENTTITFAEGMADKIAVPEDLPALPNPNIAPGNTEYLALDLIGEGPWQISLENPKEYCAYHRDDVWVEVNKSEHGFDFMIPAERSANELFIVFSSQQPTLPVELSSFSVSAMPGSAPKITWKTASETALNGYYVLRAESPHLSSAEVISPFIFAQNSSFYTTYEYEDKTAIAGKKYYYWLHILELNQVDSYAGPITLEYHEEESEQLQPIYSLTGIRDIYPNPFNPSTNISFELAQDEEVSFKIYNLRGEEVLRLDSKPYSKGLHHISIDSKTQDGRELSAGLYLLKMDAGGNSYTRKMTLLK